ncbi:MAG: hypothetical protein UY35_C0005G0069 [Candidatus Saccharibacteria bacterium GW2011_GWC2_48_9]|nr:MAG: hypothetical protein UY35_C0005G0069 [Candidatus Saccharibacteria bacterium GW2011_GWC2_48_9]HCH34232.1 hypothetical protein [Candidatus Saccharibacteria bacterium]
MKYIKATNASSLRNARMYPVAVLYAVLVVVVTTYLLYKLDIIAAEVAQSGAAGGRGGLLLAVSVASAGVFSLIYLLRLSASLLIRYTGLVCALLLPIGWGVGAWWAQPLIGGILGPVSIAVACVSVVLAVLSVLAIGIPLSPLKKRS